MRLGLNKTPLQYIEDVGRQDTFLGCEPLVARTHRQSACFSHDGTFDNLNLRPHIPHQLLDDSNLLPVFLAKISSVGLDNSEEPTQNLADSVEMPGSSLALHHRRCRWEGKLPCVGLRINLGDGRGKDVVGSQAFEQSAIGLKRLGIVLQIALIVKLIGVEKYTDNGCSILLDRASYQ